MSEGDGWESEGGEPQERPFGPRPFGPRPFGPRPFGPRPFGPRPYGPRPFGPRMEEERPFGPRPFGPRPYGPRPFGPRPFGPRPFGPRPFGPRTADADGSGSFDPDAWSAEISELVCLRSAVLRLGGTLIASDGQLPVPTLDVTVDFRQSGKPGRDPDSVAADHKALPIFRPGQWELEAAACIAPGLFRSLPTTPGLAESIKGDLADALARKVDETFLQGPGANGPLGISGRWKANAAASADALATARKLLTVVSGREQSFRNPGWILSAATLGTLAQLSTLKGDAKDTTSATARSLDSSRLLQLDGADGGVFLGFDFVLSAGAGANLYFSADWEEAWVGIEPSFVTVSLSWEAPSPGKSGVVVRASMPIDFALRRPDAFAWAVA